jgi:hypothetical protein
MRFDHLLQALARRLLRWGGRLLAWAEHSAPVPAEATPDAHEVWAAQTTQIPAGAWQRFGAGANRQEVPRPVPRTPARPALRKALWHAGADSSAPDAPPPRWPSGPPAIPAAPQWSPRPSRIRRVAAWLVSRTSATAKPAPVETPAVPRPSPSQGAGRASRRPAPAPRQALSVPATLPESPAAAPASAPALQPSSAPTATSSPRQIAAPSPPVVAGATVAPQPAASSAAAPIEAHFPQRPAADTAPPVLARRALERDDRFERPTPALFPDRHGTTSMTPAPAAGHEAPALRWPELPPAPDQGTVGNDTKADRQRLRRLEDEHAAMARGGG